MTKGISENICFSNADFTQADLSFAILSVSCDTSDAVFDETIFNNTKIPLISDEPYNEFSQLDDEQYNGIINISTSLSISDTAVNQSEDINVTIENKNNVLLIGVDGLGDALSLNDKGSYQIVPEKHNDELRLIVYGDINQEDPTHVIYLDGAKLTEYLDPEKTAPEPVKKAPKSNAPDF